MEINKGSLSENDKGYLFRTCHIKEVSPHQLVSWQRCEVGKREDFRCALTWGCWPREAVSKPTSGASNGLIRAAGLAFSLLTPTVKNLQCRRPEFDPWFTKIAWRREGASQVVLVVKNPPVNTGEVRDLGSIPVSGRSPGGGNGNPLHYSCLENPMDCRAWQATVHRVTKC